MRHRLLVTALALALMPSLASAGSSTPPAGQLASSPAAVAVVQEQLIAPLARKDSERGKYSRARLPPSERRVRVLDKAPQQDSTGNAFLTFAVDARHGWRDEDGEASWSKAAITGCVYPDRGEVFIQRGKAFHPATAAVGKKTKAAADGTCRAATRVTTR